MKFEIEIEDSVLEALSEEEALACLRKEARNLEARALAKSAETASRTEKAIRLPENPEAERSAERRRDLESRIVTDPAVSFGKPCVRGTRFAVVHLLDYVVAGESFDDLVEEFSEIEKEDVYAAILFACNEVKKAYRYSYLESEAFRETQKAEE